MVFSSNSKGVVAFQLSSWQLFRNEFKVNSGLAHYGAVVGGDDERTTRKNESRAQDWEYGLPNLIAIEIFAGPELHYLLHDEAETVE